jgi:undecaprenyl-phosphate galactose phosphotransferase
MTIAASLAGSQYYPVAAARNTVGRRLGIMAGLVSADLASFVIADLILQAFGVPPALGLFHGHAFAVPKTVIDLMGIIGLLFVAARYLAGDYSRRQLFWDGARATTGALLICSFAYMAAVLLMDPARLLVSALVWLGLIVFLPTSRHVMRLFLSQIGLWHRPTAILGTGRAAQEVYPVLGKHLSLGLDVRWVVPEYPECPIPSALSELAPINTTSDKLLEALLAAGCSQVVFVPDERQQAYQSETIDQLVGANIAVAIVPSLRRLPLFGLSTSYFFGKDLLLLQVRNNLARLPQRIIKRSIDILGSIVALALLCPVFLILAALIKFEDGGPVFFVQNRVGRGGKSFSCWKFRTMTVDAEAQMARWAHENPVLLERYRKSNFKLRADPRVTKIGQLMRRTSMDELPQIFNVLRGEMSLVGPRPLLTRELSDYGAVIALYKRVRPGITGLWQISGRSHTTFAERVSYDEWYIKNWTVWYDIVILLQTVWVLLKSEGAY